MVLLACSATVVGVTGAGAATCGGPCVALESAGTSTTLSAADITGGYDLTDQHWSVRDPDGHIWPRDAINALSIAKLLTDHGIDPLHVTLLRIWADDSTNVTVLGVDEIDSSSYLGGKFPALWVDGAQLDFVRPQHAAGDTNFHDDWHTDPGGVIHIKTSTTGHALSVTLSYTPPTADNTVTLSVGGDTPAGASYTFHFGDGTPDVTTSTPSTTHHYAQAGNWAARVTVESADDSWGAASTSVPIGKLASPPTSAPKGPTNGGAKKGPVNGAKKSTGNQADGRAADEKANGSPSGSRHNKTPKTTLPQISGTLLTVRTVSAVLPENDVASAAQVGAHRSRLPLHIPPWLAAAAILSALLGAGVVHESRSLRRSR